MLAEAVEDVASGKKVLVFCQNLKTLATARAVFDYLLQKKYPGDDSWSRNSTICHAQLGDDTKSTNFNNWQQGICLAMFSTMVLAMGIHVGDVRGIYIITPPPSVVEIYQEICRGGRDGNHCRCFIFVHTSILGLHWQKFHPSMTPSMQVFLSAIMSSNPTRCPWSLLAEEFLQSKAEVLCGICAYCAQKAMAADALTLVQQDAARASTKRLAIRSKPQLSSNIIEKGARSQLKQEQLLLVLTQARKQLVNELSALPYEICSDQALEYLVAWKIDTKTEYESVIGATKHFWAAFETALRDHSI